MLDVEDVVQVGDVADGQLKDFYFGELFVGGQSGQELPKLGEGDVEGFHSDPFPRRVGRPVLLRRSPPPTTLFPRQTGQIASVPGKSTNGVSN